MKSKHFQIQELVPKDIYEKRGDKSWELINPKLIEMIDLLKEDFPNGTITINNWSWGGDRNESGLRTDNCDNYSPTSQHSLGNAVDMIFSEYTADYIRMVVKTNPDRYPMVKGIETFISWVHLDCRNSEEVKIFRP
jgi:hypothetical protein